MNNAQNHPQRSVVLEASHVVKSYREGTSALPVLKDVNLRIHADRHSGKLLLLISQRNHQSVYHNGK